MDSYTVTISGETLGAALKGLDHQRMTARIERHTVRSDRRAAASVAVATADRIYREFETACAVALGLDPETGDELS